MRCLDWWIGARIANIFFETKVVQEQFRRVVKISGIVTHICHCKNDGGIRWNEDE